MGLMDKFKNLFTDEEIIEEDEKADETVEIKEVKKENEPPKLPTFMREKIEKEEQDNFSDSVDIKKDFKLENLIEEEDSSNKVEDKSTFKFPIDFAEDDFIETRSRQSIHNRVKENVDDNVKVNNKKINKEPKVADLYKDKKVEKKLEDDKRFRATPIISPIYGVLDKNYTPNDVESSKGDNLEEKRHSKSVDFDSVRKKAYGSLADDIKENLMCENCEYLKEVKDCKKRKKDDDEYVYDVLEEADKTSYYDNSDITIDEATENYYDYGVEYEKVKKVPREEDDDVKIVNHADKEKTTKEIPPVKSSINLLSTLKKSMGEDAEDKVDTNVKDNNLELTDDLFNLIDSMYDERNE